MLRVVLSQEEVEQAAVMGALRQARNLREKRQPAWGQSSERIWQDHIEGALGELAVAKALGVFWSGNDDRVSNADVGTLQVRAATPDRYRLILHMKDLDDSVFVLVTGAAPVLTLRGWLFGVEGKKRPYWSDPTGKGRPAYFVPQECLRPIDLTALRPYYFKRRDEPKQLKLIPSSQARHDLA